MSDPIKAVNDNLNRNGGRAFPGVFVVQEGSNVAFENGSAGKMPSTQQFIQSGMSLRDYFAAKAMQSIVSSLSTPDMAMALNEVSKEEKTPTEALIAQRAYVLADAMLAARK